MWRRSPISSASSAVRARRYSALSFGYGLLADAASSAAGFSSVISAPFDGRCSGSSTVRAGAHAKPTEPQWRMGLRQDVRFCSAADGTRIAFATIGSCPPLVRASNWLSHVEHDLESPVWRPWLRELSRRHSYIRYDQRGCGLSDRAVDDLSLDLLVGDLEAVVDHLGLKRFPLLGSSQGSATAIVYAHRHPERVSQLVLVGAYARGARRRAASDLARLEADSLVNLVRVGWGRDNDSFRQLFTNQYLPEGTAEQHRWWNDLERLTQSPEVAARTLAVFHAIDVTEIAAALEVPTLVVHSRGDARVPFDEGRRLATLIPGAQFVPLESANHILLEGEPA